MDSVAREVALSNFTKFNCMKLRLQEIELNSIDPEKSRRFYESALGLENAIDQGQLQVFQTGFPGLDFNISSHYPNEKVVISFITDDLYQVIERLNALSVTFEGPKDSHLGMMTIVFRDSDGRQIKVNQPTEKSPTWLQV